MRPGARERVMTVEQAVHAAARAVDPDQNSEGVAAFVVAFEDDERPATAPEDLAGELRSAAEEIDPEGADPDVGSVAATAYWLVTNPGDADDPERAIREGRRLFFDE